MKSVVIVTVCCARAAYLAVNDDKNITRRLKHSLVVPRGFASLDLPRKTVVLAEEEGVPSNKVRIEVGVTAAKGKI